MRIFIVVCFSLIGFWSCDKDHPDPQPEGFTLVKFNPVELDRGNPMQIYVHYMPWFEDKSSSWDGNWGMHWTMASMNPEVVDNDGRREIASHYYPLIGPYASGDPDVIEYHLLLMKYAGISGVLIDWYGATDANDFGAIRENSEALIGKLKDVGLSFAIVYEDRTIDPVLEQTAQTDAVTAAKDDMLYIQDNYFTNEQYIHIDGKPLFMVFGPEKFHSSADWGQILSAFSTDPLFLILNGKSNETTPSSSGEYIWVNNTSLDYWYSRTQNFEYFMGGGYPGFKDYYQEGGWGDGLDWEIAHNNGTTLEQSLAKAAENSMDYLQLITWNDFGEGTMIEPSIEFEYDFLRSVQNFAELDYGTAELESIYTLYKLRKEKEGNASLQKQLDQAFYYFVSLQTEKAINLLDSISTL